MRGLIAVLGFCMVTYVVLTIIKVVGEMFWPDSFKGRRKR